MDFGSLLNAAKKNEQTPKKEIKYYSTKFEPPKKIQKNKQLSENIKKFLAKKEAEEKQKLLEAQKEKEKLLALRAQDRKAQRRVQVMLKRTKSANQSAIQDAVDADNTAVTLAGPSQPDEDDYGYVSQESSALYNKMMAKYSAMPDEPKFDFTKKKKVSTDIKSTKDRVRAAILKEQEEALLPHKRKRKHKESTTDLEERIEDKRSEKGETFRETEKSDTSKPPVKIKKKPMPPPLNFYELLKIAEQKQHEPIIIEKKVEEDGPLLTKKQKLEYERELAARERRESENNGKQSKPSVKMTEEEIMRIKQLNNADFKNRSKLSRDEKQKIIEAKKSKNCEPEKPKPSISKTTQNEKQADERPKKYLPGDLRNKNTEPEERTDRKYLPGDLRYKPEQGNSKKPSEPPIKQSSTIVKKDITSIKQQEIKKQKVPVSKHPSSVTEVKHKEKLLKTKPAAARIAEEVKPKVFPPPDVRRLKKKPVQKRRIIDDDDEEYDSEMDDFIDDGPEYEEDYSKQISEIFGYDRSKYRYDEEDDDDIMETSFARQMREEYISSKIGLMEDLEDIKKEAEEKKRKMIMKKKLR